MMIELSGRLDAHAAAAVRSRLHWQMVSSAQGATVEVDMSQVEFLDSRGLRTLIDFHTAAQNFGSRLSVSSASAPVRHLLRLTGQALPGIAAA